MLATVNGDEAVVALLQEGLAPTPGPLAESLGLQWWATVVGRRDGQVDLELVQDGRTVRAWIALPESGRPMPWIDEPRPVDPAAWVGCLTRWLDEEMCTGAVGPEVLCEVEDGVSRLVVDGYGSADLELHRQLRKVIGPHGWWAPGTRSQFRQQYAAEWALDEVERHLDDKQNTWLLTSPDGVAVEVHSHHENGTVDLTALTGRRRRESGRRRLAT